MTVPPSFHRPPRPGVHFAWSEFERSGYAAKHGIVNVAPREAAWAITRWCALVGEPLRRHVGRPVRVTSGYRSPELNHALGGSPTSQHLTGEAADLKVRGMDAFAVYDTLRAICEETDQIIIYHPQRGGHVHVSVRVLQPSRPKTFLYAPPWRAAVPPGVQQTHSGYWNVDDPFTQAAARDQFDVSFDGDGDPVENAGNSKT